MHVHHRVCVLVCACAYSICGVCSWLEKFASHFDLIIDVAADRYTNGKTNTHTNLISCCVQASSKLIEIPHTFTYIVGSKSQAVCRANCFAVFFSLFKRENFTFSDVSWLVFFLLSFENINLEKTTTSSASSSGGSSNKTMNRVTVCKMPKLKE